MSSSVARYDEDDPTFVDDLQRSDESVVRAAFWMRRRWGVDIYLPALRVRPKAEAMAEYSDAGDLFIRKGAEAWRRIEIAVRNLSFTSAADYPYPSVIVDAAHRWDAANPKPAAYLRFSRTMSHVLVIRSTTSEHWTRRTRHDRQKGRDRTFLECEPRYIVFLATGIK